MIIIEPSILAADYGSFKERSGSAGCWRQALRVDVMDGHFVPNITFGPGIIRAITLVSLFLDVHLITQPGALPAGSSQPAPTALSCTEACPPLPHPRVHPQLGPVRRGLNPGTPAHTLDECWSCATWCR
jgi:ribulose-phosphate 3-epimerase